MELTVSSSLYFMRRDNPPDDASLFADCAHFDAQACGGTDDCAQVCH
jgi:hypothetical protein